MTVQNDATENNHESIERAPVREIDAFLLLKYVIRI